MLDRKPKLKNVQWTLDNWNTHGRRKFVPLIKSFQLWKPKCVQIIGEWNGNVFSNRSNYQSVPIIRVPIIEGPLYYDWIILYPIVILTWA